MATEHEYLSVLVALNAALLLILAGVAKQQLDWKRPGPQPLSRRLREMSWPSPVGLPPWMKAVLIAAAAILVVVSLG